jgi:hypothetical protein
MIHDGKNKEIVDKHVPAPLRALQIPRGLAWQRTQSNAVCCRQLTTNLRMCKWLIAKLGTKDRKVIHIWRWLASITPWPLCYWYPLNKSSQFVWTLWSRNLPCRESNCGCPAELTPLHPVHATPCPSAVRLMVLPDTVTFHCWYFRPVRISFVSLSAE